VQTSCTQAFFVMSPFIDVRRSLLILGSRRSRSLMTLFHVTNLSFLPVTVIPRRLHLYPYSFHHIELRFVNKINTNHIISIGLFERRTPAQVVKFVAGRLAEVPHLLYFAACASCPYLSPPPLQHKKVQLACEELVLDAEKAGSGDNITALVICFCNG
jgi:hypothetical protein